LRRDRRRMDGDGWRDRCGRNMLVEKVVGEIERWERDIGGKTGIGGHGWRDRCGRDIDGKTVV
jgi:hypothetical protein